MGEQVVKVKLVSSLEQNKIKKKKTLEYHKLGNNYLT